jgi:methionyl-tRNA synthetase
LYGAVKLKAASTEVRRLSQRVNQYITDTAPFQMIKTDPAAAATSVWCALQCIQWLNILWSPIIPFSSQKVHEMLGFTGQLFGRQFTQSVTDARGGHLVLRYDHSDAMGSWDAMPLPAGQALTSPQALFVKLDDSVPDQEAARAAEE